MAEPTVHSKANSIADGRSYFARAGNAQLWCRTYSFPRQRGYTYRNYGNRDGAHILCNEVARRAQFFYDMWLGNDDAACAFTPEHEASYEKGAEFQEWFVRVVPNSLLRRAALQVQLLFPAKPEAE